MIGGDQSSRSVSNHLLVALSFVICVGLLGCDKQEAAAKKFKNMCAQLMPRIVSAYTASPDRYSTTMADGLNVFETTYEISPQYSIDVRKTESVISPYEGTMQFDVAERYHNTVNGNKVAQFVDNFRGQYVLTFAYQEGRWVYKTANRTGSADYGNVYTTNITAGKRIRIAISGLDGPVKGDTRQ